MSTNFLTIHLYTRHRAYMYIVRTSRLQVRQDINYTIELVRMFALCVCVHYNMVVGVMCAHTLQLYKNCTCTFGRERRVRVRERERERERERCHSTPQCAQCLFIVDVSWTQSSYHGRSRVATCRSTSTHKKRLNKSDKMKG